jgi:hypothetical protein
VEQVRLVGDADDARALRALSGDPDLRPGVILRFVRAGSDTTEGGRTGYLVEFGESRQIFENPAHPHTQQYIRGEFS